MRNTVLDKRLPTILALMIIVVGIALTSILIKSGIIFETKATPSEIPKNIRITNIADTSFTVSYLTDASVIGSISFGKDKNLASIAIDDRDQNNTNISPRKLHYITIRGLAPNTKYYFSITSGAENFLKNNQPFETTTGPVIQSQPLSQQPITGKIASPDGTNITEAIVYFTAKDAQAISTLNKAEGNYILPLNTIRKEDLSSYFLIPPDTTVKMLIVGSTLESNITLSTKQMSPVPVVSLSQNYDFTVNNSPVASSPAEFGFPALSSNPSSSEASSMEILTPKKDESFSDQQPLFRGIASPGANVDITIHSSEEIQVQIKADNFGHWSFRPQVPLSPGQHSLLITSKDTSGALKTLTQTFTVYADGTQISQSATPSASPTIFQPQASPTSSPTPTIIPPSPTPLLVTNLTLTPTPGNTQEVISPPGNSTFTTLTLASIFATALGIGLFIFTKKNGAL